VTPQPILSHVPINLGGVERRLVFDFNAQAAFEKVTGVSVFDNKAMKTSSRIVRALLWAQLLHFDEKVRFDEFGEIVSPPELSMQEVGKLINRANMPEINLKVFQAFTLFFRESKPQTTDGVEEKEAPANPPSR
jgi:hypothetical protein